MTTFKSVHIEGCWPYQYIPAKGARRRERKRQAGTREAVVAKQFSRKLLCLPVVEMTDNQFFESINNVYTR